MGVGVSLKTCFGRRPFEPVVGLDDASGAAMHDCDAIQETVIGILVRFSRRDNSQPMMAAFPMPDDSNAHTARAEDIAMVFL